MTDDRAPALCVLAPDPLLAVEIEEGRAGGGPEIHVHLGGQGLWLARMAYSLGARVVVCGPFGGEVGDITAHLARSAELELRTTGTAGAGALVQDRRSGEPEEIATMHAQPLDRHGLDDLYGTTLVTALESDVCVLTGSRSDIGVPGDFYGRLVADLRASDRPIVADLSGEPARAVVEAGCTVLKISHDEMVEGGFAKSAELDDLRGAARAMVGEGPAAVVVSRADEPTLVVSGDGDFLVIAPPMTTVDHRGAGDSMTAGIAVGVGRGVPLPQAVALGAAAGALNVARHGLGTGRREQIEAFAERVTVEGLS
ncbi:PfkB family carbohydrate kinase [Puerhibacterium sp. TATVAM-FAB25]|uniref:PfkB family carbohydrate kinase n=1 Tax=Puerhibacterium sp. TATVAM-FAB25 TaxID=3093699 RepID=UPI00397915B7